MRRNLITAAMTASLMLGATAAFADNNWPFDDPYWKPPQTVGTVQPTLSHESLSKYLQIDCCNP